MIALLRYQAANLFRSHRWIFPLIALCAADLGGRSRLGSGPAVLQARALSDGLDWSAAILVPVVALLTRSMLTAEPAAARACVAAASGPRAGSAGHAADRVRWRGGPGRWPEPAYEL